MRRFALFLCLLALLVAVSGPTSVGWVCKKGICCVGKEQCTCTVAADSGCSSCESLCCDTPTAGDDCMPVVFGMKEQGVREDVSHFIMWDWAFLIPSVELPLPSREPVAYVCYAVPRQDVDPPFLTFSPARGPPCA